MKLFKTGFLFCLLGVSGCRLLDRDRRDYLPVPGEIIGGVPPLGDAPDFGIPVPRGCFRVVHFGELPLNGVVKVKPGRSKVRVFIKLRVLNLWFSIGESYSSAYWYTRDLLAGLVKYQGADLSLKAYCIYQDIKTED